MKRVAWVVPIVVTLGVAVWFGVRPQQPSFVIPPNAHSQRPGNAGPWIIPHSTTHAELLCLDGSRIQLTQEGRYIQTPSELLGVECPDPDVADFPMYLIVDDASKKLIRTKDGSVFWESRK